MEAFFKSSVSQQSLKMTHCWEFKKCGQILCPAYLNDSGVICYYLSSTRCTEDVPKSITAKIEECKKCDFYQYNEKQSLEFKENILKRLRKLENELQSLFKVSPEEKAAVFKRRAEQLSKRLSGEEKEEKTRVLTFSLGNEKYCIRINYTLEIINVTDINRLPCTPHHFAGVINLKGTILTLVDLGQFLGIEKDSPNGSKTIIVIGVGGLSLGLLIDEVEDILDVAVDHIAPPLTTLKEIEKEFTEGEIFIKGKPFTLLNLEKMVMDKRMKVFEIVNPK